jgi:hypothetical protein
MGKEWVVRGGGGDGLGLGSSRTSEGTEDQKEP